MQIIDLNEENRELYFNCLEDWSDEMRESGNHKACWYEKMRDKGLGVKLAQDDHGKIGGMIQYYPSAFAPIKADHFYFLSCIWVHGYKQGRGNFQKQGMGKALLQAAETDIAGRGAKGIAAWGLALPFWMKASWFKKQGYKKADRDGIAVLLWKPFFKDAQKPIWIKERKKPQKQPGKVTVTAFINGYCPAQNISFERAKRAAAEFGERVEFVAVNTFERDTFLEWGVNDAIFIDDKNITKGPPLTYEKIRKKIGRRVRRLH